jgi:hypothetical protein
VNGPNPFRYAVLPEETGDENRALIISIIVARLPKRRSEMSGVLPGRDILYLGTPFWQTGDDRD